MAIETYPWGNKTPAQRIAALEGQIRANDKKRSDAEEAHKKKLTEIDEAGRQLKADLKVATNIADRERREATNVAASRLLEKITGGLSTEQLEAAIKSGSFEKLLADALTGEKKKAGAPKQQPSPPAPPAPPAADKGSGENAGLFGDGPA